ncbi:EpsG family protein [Haloflavibacter putidus]|uniref:EpsG family protein n=1 Tax=Haloflavibacter putidus TaxID=2576776 RepID=A0A507ZBQ3_9FLAO|nr:EpsG family protein [Haloflavibacter putidus]TQD33494.1 EpsG family protein [Haloflavibacter putidus]
MIPIEYYIPTYYVAISLVLVFSTLPLFKYTYLENFPTINLQAGSVFLLLVTIGFIGLRDPWGHWSYLGDTGAYTRTYDLIQEGIRTEFSKDVGFYIFMKLCSQIMGIQGFYLLSAILYVGLPYLTFKKWFGQYAFFALAAFVAAMSFWSFGINGVRSGLASSIFIFALSFRDKKWVLYALMLLAITFHKSMLLPMAAYIFASFYNNTKVLMLVWLGAIPVSLVVGQELETLISGIFTSDTVIADERALTYFSGDDKDLYTEQRFRLDFVIYSAIPILLAYWQLFKNKYKNKLFTFLINIYLIANTAWILLIYVPYTNRLAYLSWFLMPVILIFPFITIKEFKSNNKVIGFILFGSLIFSLLMQFR